ncbi:MAG: HK97 family phage prohead protease [Tsuneonella sp.]
MDRLEFKFAPEGMDAKTGEFAGYGAIFGNRDSHGDVIERGAFADSLRQWEAKGSLPVMKLMHGTTANPFGGSDLPVGKWKAMREDERGLFVEGKLSGMETDRGRYHYALMQDGALSGLSIGYRPTKHTPGMGNIKRRLQSVHLAEVSLVPEASNDQTFITDMKSWDAGALPSLPQFEEFLREAGFSKTQATAIAGKGLAPLLRGEPGNTTEADEYLAALAAQLRA